MQLRVEVLSCFDPTTSISDNTGAVQAQVAGLIKSIKPFCGAVLGSADTMPRGTRLENVRLIRELVAGLGSNT